MFSYRKEQVFNENYIERQFYDFFILREDELNIENIKVQESEVENVKFVSMSELNDMINNNEIVEREPIYREIMNYVFRM